MTRSLCFWLACVCFGASPSVASAQTLIGQSRLAPVALEARCRFADGMYDGSTTFVGLGHDPLHAAVLAEDYAPAVAPAVASRPAQPEAEQVKVAVVDVAKKVDSRCEPFCPMADLAQHEPLDVEQPIVAEQRPATPPSLVPR